MRQRVERARQIQDPGVPRALLLAFAPRRLGDGFAKPLATRHALHRFDRARLRGRDALQRGEYGEAPPAPRARGDRLRARRHRGGARALERGVPLCERGVRRDARREHGRERFATPRDSRDIFSMSFLPRAKRFAARRVLRRRRRRFSLGFREIRRDTRHPPRRLACDDESVPRARRRDARSDTFGTRVCSALASPYRESLVVCQRLERLGHRLGVFQRAPPRRRGHARRLGVRRGEHVDVRVHAAGLGEQAPHGRFQRVPAYVDDAAARAENREGRAEARR